jgi:hypothetical protein
LPLLQAKIQFFLIDFDLPVKSAKFVCIFAVNFAFFGGLTWVE